MQELKDLGPLYDLLNDLFPFRNHHNRLNVTRTATELGVKKQHLYKAMKQGIPPGLALRIIEAARKEAKTAKEFDHYYGRILPLLNK